MGGHFTHVDGVSVARLAAIDIATCTVKSFRAGSISATVRAIAATDSTVYFGGDFNSVRGTQRSKFAAVDATSGALQPWQANADAPGRAVAVSPDENQVAVGGDFFTINGNDAHSMAVLDASTADIVKTFGAGNNTETQIPATSVTKAITTDDTGFYVANEGTGGGVFDGKLALDYSDLSQRWRDRCLGANQALVVNEATLYSANHAHDCELMGWQTDGRRVYLQAQTVEAPTAAVAWKPDLNDGIGEGIGGRALTVAQKGEKSFLWVGGEFTLTNGHTQRGLTRFASGPESAKSPTPGRLTAESLKEGEIQVRWRSSIDDDDGNLTYRVYRNGSSTPIATIEGESTWWHAPQQSFVDTDVQAGQTYSYRVTASDGYSTSGLSATASATAATEDAPYASEVLNDGATLYWRFNEQNDIYGADSSNGNKQVRFLGSPDLRATENAVEGGDGFAIGFNGSSSYALNDTFAPGPDEYTIETWIKTTTDRGGKIMGYGDGNPRTDNGRYRASSSYDRHIYMSNDGKLTFGAYDGGTKTASSSTAYNDGEWHHIVASQGASGMKLYVDGAVVGRNGNVGAQDYRGSWRVGGDNLNGWPNRPASDFFAGQIDETAVYEKVLTPLQVDEHFTASGGTSSIPQAPQDAYGAAVFEQVPDFFWRFSSLADEQTPDSGIFGADGQLRGSVQPEVVGVWGAAASLGSDGFVSSPVANSPSPEFTAEMWFSTSAQTGGRLIGFSSSPDGDSNNYDRHVYMRDDGRLVFGTWTGSENTAVSPDAYNDGSWHHLAAMQSSSGMKMFVDGAEVASNPQSSAQSFNGYWRVGGDRVWGGASQDFLSAVKVDEVALYAKALSANEVAKHHSLGAATPPGDGEEPSSPGGLDAKVTDGTVDLSWDAATDNVGVAGYEVHRSATEGFSATEATKIADGKSTAYADTPPEAGEWFYQVIAYDAAGNRSEPASASATLENADTEDPTAVENLKGVVSGSSVDLSWDAATDNVGVAGYEVHRSATEGFSASEATKIADGQSTAYADTPPEAGEWFYQVIAYDAAGNRSEPASASATLENADTEDPTAVENLKGVVSGSSVDLSWDAATDNVGIAGYRVHRAKTAGFEPSTTNKLGGSPDLNYVDADVDPGTWYYKVVSHDEAGNSGAPSDPLEIKIEAAEPVGSTITLPTVADVMVNEGAPSSAYGSSSQLASRGSLGYLSYLRFEIPDTPEGTHLSGAKLKLRTSTASYAGSTDTHQVRVADNDWEENTTTWRNRPELTGVAIGELKAGAEPNTEYSISVEPRELIISEGSSMTLALASLGTDNAWFWSRERSVEAYRPALELTFAPGAGPELPDPLPEPEVVELSPTKDAMTNASAARDTYGSVTQLASRGTPGYSTFLEFNLPDAPSGLVLTDANLRFRTTTASYAGSTDTHLITAIDAVWDESTINHANRPMASGQELGEIGANTKPNTAYDVALDPETVSKLLGDRTTLDIEGSGSDNIWFWSRERSVADQRPVLVLTFGGE
ncbi:LamG-like jellyroll fold domain-containing protein [Arthrobacter rhombi]|uniref:LamG-like jellyroll fold domain-containing protein n=1 Tax=Arthrobacter rhombi TaxID=71253 RepID=UPI003FCFC381